MGDFLDMTHRANMKNARLIEEHLRQVNVTFNKSALRARPDSGPLDHVANRAASDDDSDSEDDDDSEAVTPAVRV